MNQSSKNGKLVNWLESNNYLIKEFEFQKYLDGISFVDKIAIEAEKQKHHPDIEIFWCKVVIKLTSHDTGKITEKDVKLASVIDKLFNQGSKSGENK